MSKFTYNDIVRVDTADRTQASCVRGWVVGVFEERQGPYFNQFPKGVIYTIEFEDGSSAEVHEDQLMAESIQTAPELKRGSA